MIHLTPFTPDPLFPLSSEERGLGGEVLNDQLIIPYL